MKNSKLSAKNILFIILNERLELFLFIATCNFRKFYIFEKLKTKLKSFFFLCLRKIKIIYVFCGTFFVTYTSLKFFVFENFKIKFEKLFV